MNTAKLLSSILLVATPVVPWLAASSQDSKSEASDAGAPAEQVQVQYLEIVTPEVDATCLVLEAERDVRFGEPEADLGNARTAKLVGGGMIGVRAPMHGGDGPVVRPYLLVDDIEASVEAALAEGAQLAHPPLEIAGRGTFAIYILGGIEHGLWQN